MIKILGILVFLSLTACSEFKAAVKDTINLASGGRTSERDPNDLGEIPASASTESGRLELVSIDINSTASRYTVVLDVINTGTKVSQTTLSLVAQCNSVNVVPFIMYLQPLSIGERRRVTYAFDRPTSAFCTILNFYYYKDVLTRFHELILTNVPQPPTEPPVEPPPPPPPVEPEPVRYDLLITDRTAPSSIKYGQTVNVSATIKNRTNTAIAANRLTTSVSFGGISGNGFSFQNSSEVAANGEIKISGNLSLIGNSGSDCGKSVDLIWKTVAVDSLNKNIGEDTRYGSITIDCSTPPPPPPPPSEPEPVRYDLLVTDRLAPSSIGYGQTISVSATVKNRTNTPIAANRLTGSVSFGGISGNGFSFQNSSEVAANGEIKISGNLSLTGNSGPDCGKPVDLIWKTVVVDSLNKNIGEDTRYGSITIECNNPPPPPPVEPPQPPVEPPQPPVIPPELGLTDTLSFGQRMHPNQKLVSANGRFQFNYYSNGVLCVTEGDKLMWTAAGAMPVGLHFEQEDVMVSEAGARLVLDNSAQLIIYSSSNSVIRVLNAGWEDRRGPGGSGETDALFAGQKMFPGESLISANRQYHLDYQTNGNLVLYKTGYGPLWSTNTSNFDYGFLELRENGNLCLFNSFGDISWQTYTSEATALVIDNSGQLILYTGSGSVEKVFGH